ncbi:MAG: nucleoside deaminase [Bacteroides sp.]|nr:MAG: nucleoside deaminase [Bacteroides sp.]
MNDIDNINMKYAFKEALCALYNNEVPIGAVIVDDKNIILGKGHNMTNKLKDLSAHAEIQAMTAACNYLGSKYLKKCTLYVTLEPCMMCMGAAYLFMINRIVYGAKNSHKKFINHKKNIILNFLNSSTEHSEMLKSFFKKKRIKYY